jgi:hypothetical protein
MERVAEPVSAEPAIETVAEGDRLASLLDGIDPPTPAPVVRETYGTVAAFEADAVVVHVAGRPLKARRAVSCLVEPAIGDRVLVAISDDSFVLAVLVKGEAGAPGVTLAVDGDVTLRSRGGKVALVANDAVSLASATKVELNAPELEVRALKTSFFSASLSYIGRALDGEIDRVKVVARSVDRAIDRVTERIQNSFRTVEGIDRVRAKELDIDVEGNFSVHADNTIIGTEKLVKVDGEQIHLG